MPKFKDISDQRFGRWTVLSFAGRREVGAQGKKHAYWNVRCDCGTEKAVSVSSLTSGASTSCGCRKSEVTSARNTTHGLSHMDEYQTWAKILRRCRCENDPAYGDYGGRGIDVCAEWEDFGVFIRDMGPRPSREHTIDRIDNDKGYSSSNCRWATKIEQGCNRRNSVIWEFDGQRNTVSQWSRLTGVSQTTLRNRVTLYGWSVERALTTPPRHHD